MVVRVSPCPRCEDGMVPGQGGWATRHCLVPVVPRPALHQHPTSPPSTLCSPLLPTAPVCPRLPPSHSAEYCRVVACVVTKYSAQFGPLQPAAGQTGAPREWSRHLQTSSVSNLIFHNVPVYFFLVSYSYRTKRSKNSRGSTLFACACCDSAIFHM